MSFTRVQAETVLVERLGPAMRRADMQTLIDGTNPNLIDPIAYGLYHANGTMATDPTNPSDADLATLTNDQWYVFLLLAEWRLATNIHGNLDDVDTKLGPTGEWQSQFAKQMAVRIESLETTLGQLGYGPSTISTGTMRVFTSEIDADA